MINLNYLKTIFGDDQKEINEFLNLFVNSAQKSVQEIEQATQNKNVRLLKFQLHKLKGSAGNSGFVKLADVCKQAEDNIEQQDWTLIARDCLEIKNYILRLENEVAKKSTACS